MQQNIDPQLKEILVKIGDQVRLLRKTNTNLDYKKHAAELKLSDKTLLRIEHGSDNYLIGSLIKILQSYEDVKLSKFFQDCGL